MSKKKRRRKEKKKNLLKNRACNRAAILYVLGNYAVPGSDLPVQ
jgi:hypothetical protein